MASSEDWNYYIGFKENEFANNSLFEQFGDESCLYVCEDVQEPDFYAMIHSVRIPLLSLICLVK